MQHHDPVPLSQGQLQRLLDELPECVFVKDRQSRFLLVNKACEDLWGAAAEELLGSTGSSFFPAEQIARFLDRDAAVFSSGTTQRFEETYWMAKYQANRTGYTTKTAVFDAAGQPQFLIGVTQDITEKKAAKQALEQSEQRYYSLFDSLQVGALIQGPNEEVLLANPRAMQLLKLSAGQLLGRSFLDSDWDIVGEDGTRLLRSDLPVPQAIQQRAPVRGVILGLNRPRMEGRQWLVVSAIPQLNDDGSVEYVIVTLGDVTELKHAEQRLLSTRETLQDSAQHTQAILDNMLDGVITINARGIVETINKAACAIFGYTAAEVQGNNISMLMPMPHRVQHDGYLEHFQKTGEARVIGIPRELHGQRKDGSMLPISLSVSKVVRDGQPIFVGILRDITQARHDEEEIRRLAFYDPLTSLPNRRLLVDRLKQAVVNSARTRQHGSVMFLDLDHFKVLNDSQGHDMGDALLRQVATRLTSCVREGDSVARLGGDEFVVLLEGLSGNARDAANHAELIAGKILSTLSQPYNLGGYIHNSTPSIGVVIFMEGHETTDDLLKKADVAMYQAKSSGRNTVRFFDPEMQAIAAERSALERDIRNGLALGEFLLYYQLQVDGNGHATGAEALVRWNHPVRGLVSPAEFIPLAEETGLILPLGQWVLQTACAQLVAWSKDPTTAHLKLSVNVSALQIAQLDFVDNVAAALQSSGASPALLKLELTESMLAKDVERIIVKMHAIKAMGVGFSLDDFGTGYSSLTYLKRLPMDQLKIDQSFVRDLHTDPNDAAIARTVVALGHNLGLNVIAEGVETAAQRDLLLGLGCNAFQGYFFARPCPAAEIAQRLQEIQR